MAGVFNQPKNPCSQYRTQLQGKEKPKKNNAENQHALPIGLFLSLRSL